MTRAEARAKWPEVVKIAKAKSLLTGALLEASRPSSVSGLEVESRFDHGITKFHVAHLRMDIVRDAFLAVFGNAATLRMVGAE